ncbi:PQQ-binding-like beta-propeller repeat protein [Cohnella mopanensis]|uniref:PQQ-binding-like beta-propeller repeat protein n=1 Tax=Cohnella mopanensis TaxID=2911966 RepID=UPI001EF7D994|nr:PQQ-binding-like beta-propeller repeat protein [Cohnella mopanensis]
MKNIILFVIAVLAVVLGVLGAGVADAGGLKGQSSYIGDNYDYLNDAKTVEPTWTVDMSGFDPGFDLNSGVALVEEGKVFYLNQGQLLALSVKTGKRIWKYGSGLKLPLAYSDGKVFVASGDGTLHAVNTTTGKRIWASSAKQPDVHQFTVANDELISVSDHVYAYRLSDGKRLWKDDYEFPAFGTVTTMGDVLVERHWESGAYMYDMTLGLDRKTGKVLWKLMDIGEPLYVDDAKGTFMARHLDYIFAIDKPEGAAVKTVDWRTGKVLKTTEYESAKINPNGKERIIDTVFVSGGKIYLSFGIKVLAYPLDADPAAPSTKKEIYWVYGGNSNVNYAAGPAAGKVFFVSKDGRSYRLYGVKTEDKAAVVGYAIDNPIARFDILGNGLYIYQTDQKLIVMNLSKNRTLFRMDVPTRAFGPTLRDSGMIVVQTRGQLLAFPEPAELKETS